MRRIISAPASGTLVRAGSGARSSTSGGRRASLPLALLLLTAASALSATLYLHNRSHRLYSVTRTVQLSQEGGAALAAAQPAAAGAAVGGGANASGRLGAPSRGQLPEGSLDYPLWWHAPFISPSGLGAEALSIIEALVSTRQMLLTDIYITHSGDTFEAAVLKGLSPDTRNLLSQRQHPQQVADEWLDILFPSQKAVQLQRLAEWPEQRKAIAVCHNWFECWRAPRASPSTIPGCPCPLGKERAAYTVARTMFETAGLPAHLAEYVKAMDEVWVPTSFNRDTFASAGVDPAKIRVVPEGLDTDVWDPARIEPIDPALLELRQATGPPAPPNASLPANATRGAAAPARPYVFLSVFKWEARKGYKELVRGFCDAFKPSDPVVLWILARPFMESGTDFDAKVAAFAAEHYRLRPGEAASRLPRIYVSSARLSEADFMRVYRSADCLAIPTHGEGWGRPQIEAMAMELPVITTNWSGPTAFMNERVAYPLAIEGLSTVKSDGDPNFFQAFIGQQWAAPSVPHLTALLQRVVSRPAEAAAKGKAARAHIRAHFTPRVIAGVVASEVRRLQAVVRARQAQVRPRGVAGKKGLFSRLGAVRE